MEVNLFGFGWLILLGWVLACCVWVVLVCLLLLFAGGWVTCYLIVLIDLIYLVLVFDGCFVSY